MASPDETEISALDALVHSYEFENKNYIKMIEKENQTILELQAQSQQITNEAKQLSLVIPQLEENIKHVDKQYMSMLDNIDSQKKTRNLLADHELALTKQIEAMRITTEEKSKFYKDQISSYTKVRAEYMEQYASLSLAKQLNAKKSELSVINKKVTEIHDKKKEIKQQIQETENYLDSHDRHRIVVKIAETKLEITKLNEEITQIQAEKSASREFDKGCHPEELNLSQQHSQDDIEGSDTIMEIDTNYSLSDINTNDSHMGIHKQNINDFNQISLDVNTDSHDKVIPNKTFGANLCSGNNEVKETNADSVGDEDFNMTETEFYATNSKAEVKSTGFSTELPQGLAQWSQSTNTKCFPKPPVPSLFAASTTSTQFLSSFSLPSLPQLPTLRQFSKEQFITPLSKQNQITNPTQAKSENKFHFTSSHLPLKPVLQSEQLIRGLNLGRNSTISQFQNPTTHLVHNADMDINLNNAQNITSSLLQKSTLPSLEKEQSTANVNEARANTFHQFQNPTTHLVHSADMDINFNNAQNVTSCLLQKSTLASLQKTQSTANVHEARANTFHQFQKPTASILQSDQSNSDNIRLTTAFQSQKSVTSLSVIEETNKTIEGIKSATPFQLQKPSLHIDLSSSNLQPATSMTPANLKASTPRFMLKPFPLPVAQLKSPSAAGNNERAIKENHCQRPVDIVKAKELPPTQGFQFAFPKVPNQIVAPAPTISTTSEVPSSSIFKLNIQVNETATKAKIEHSMQPKEKSTFSFLSFETSDDETDHEQKNSPQNAMLEDNATNDGAGFLTSFTFNEPTDDATNQTDKLEFSLMFESSKNQSSNSNCGANSSNNEMPFFAFGKFLQDISDAEDNEPGFFSTMSSHSHETTDWANFSEDDSPQPDPKKL